MMVDASSKHGWRARQTKHGRNNTGAGGFEGGVSTHHLINQYAQAQQNLLKATPHSPNHPPSLSPSPSRARKISQVAPPSNFPQLTGLSKRPPARRGGSGSIIGDIASTNPCTSPGASSSGRGGFATQEAQNTREKDAASALPVSGGCSIDPSSPCKSHQQRKRGKKTGAVSWQANESPG